MLKNELLCLVLVGARNPLNIGAVARAMSNFGFDRLRVVNPFEVAFREARSAVGASKVLAQAEEYTNLSDAIADCGLVVGTGTVSHRQLKHSVMDLEQGAARIHKSACKVALIFGSEKRGLSNHDLSHCHWLLRIPTHETQPSMNLAQAVAVCLYELSRRPHHPTPESSSIEPAAAQDLERLTTLLTQVLHSTGYTRDEARGSTEEKIRRLTRRLRLSEGDARLLLGMLRHIGRGQA